MTKKKAAPVKERQVWWFQFERSSKLWRLTHHEKPVTPTGYKYKEMGTRMVRAHARVTAKEKDIVIELRICGMDGQIQDSCTYPRSADPKNVKG